MPRTIRVAKVRFRCQECRKFGAIRSKRRGLEWLRAVVTSQQVYSCLTCGARFWAPEGLESERFVTEETHLEPDDLEPLDLGALRAERRGQGPAKPGSDQD